MIKLNWKFLDIDFFKASDFGLKKLYALKVAKWKNNNEYDDIRCFSLRNWKILASLEEYCPVKNKKLNKSVWYVFAAKGE